jgi:hypothetical protein
MTRTARSTPDLASLVVVVGGIVWSARGDYRLSNLYLRCFYALSSGGSEDTKAEAPVLLG